MARTGDQKFFRELPEEPLTEFDSALTAGVILANAWLEDSDYAIVPDGFKIEDLESYREAPRRIHAVREFTDLRSFTEYWDVFEEDASAIFIDTDQSLVHGILDHHDVDAPRWGNHVANYRAPKDDRWLAWTGSDQKRMNQAEFARFIEDNLYDILAPDPAEVLECVRHLQATKKVIFQSDRHDNAAGDVVFRFETETNQLGELHVPEVFTITIPVYRGAELYEVEARFRYSISDAGHLVLWYDILRPEDVERRAKETLVESVRGIASNGRVYLAKL